ncbi:unnamed protein product [Urochloa decumbens]|uniref:Pectinesterase inhibitor domain-containing protein n=1 Tax=Urochloa decumbens TaxID=240449 RepID=A0ABC8W9G0_9POAL
MASGSSPATLTAAAFLALLLSSAARAAEASSAAPAAALDQVCGRLGSYYVTPALCASALCADPSTPCRAARDLPAVAALAARLAADNATAARDSIEAALLNSSSSSSPPAGPAANNSSAAASASAAAAAAAAARSSCLQLYAGAVPALRWAARAVAAGRYRGAREVLQAAQYVASGCEGMAGDAAAAALPRENGGFGDMAFVAHAVVASMAAD